MDSKLFLEAESTRFNALSTAEQKEELRHQQYMAWMISKRDTEMILPACQAAPPDPQLKSKPAKSSKSCKIDFSPLFC